MDEYEFVTLEPNLINLMNLHTIIYNRHRGNTMNLIEGVDPRIANDTSDIQEALNAIVVEHVTMMGTDPECDTVMRPDDISSEMSGNLYVLKDGDAPICYSKSRYILLICGSNMMTEKNEYGVEMDISKV